MIYKLPFLEDIVIPRLTRTHIRAMQQMWRTCKSYFGDGFVPGSSPLRYDVHVCNIDRPSTKNGSTCYGVELDEDTLPLFTVFGESRAPPCSCNDIRALVKYIDGRLETLPDSLTGDYSLHTEKGDRSVDAACCYALRDALCWWAHWHGTLAGHRWKHLYVAFSTIPDDVQIPPMHLVDGTFTLIGHTLADILAGLAAEGMRPEDVKFAEMCLWRQYILQYLEKADPTLREMLVGKTTLMTQFRAITANTHGVAVCLRRRGVSDEAVEMAAICDCLSMDMAKEALGVLKGEKTETVAGNRALLNQELRWVYTRCMNHLDAQRGGKRLRRLASSGFHFVPTMDRYLERVQMVRWPLTPAMRCRISSYVKGNVIANYDEM